MVLFVPSNSPIRVFAVTAVFLLRGARHDRDDHLTHEILEKLGGGGMGVVLDLQSQLIYIS